MIAHGYAEAEKDAAHKAVEAGADIDMMTSAYAANLKQLVEEKKIDEALIDEAADRARVILTANRSHLEALKDALIEHETLDAQEVADLLKDAVLPDSAKLY